MSVFGSPAPSSGSMTGPTGSIAASAVSTVVGDVVVCAIDWVGASTSLSSVTDTAGNSYSLLTARNDGATTILQIAYTIATHANASNVVIGNFNNTAAQFVTIGVLDFPITGGTASFNSVDAGNTALSVSTLTTSSFSTTGTDELVVAFGASNGNNNGSLYIPGSGYTLDGFSGIGIGGEHRLFTTTQSGITASMSWPSSGNSRIAATAFSGMASGLSLALLLPILGIG